MKSKMIIGLCIAMCAVMAVADTESEGGLVVNPSSFKGKIAIVNAQKVVSNSEIENVATTLSNASGCNVVTESGSPAITEAASHKNKSQAEVAIVVVADETTPAMLLAPEDHWGVVNVNRLTDDLGSERAKVKFLPHRTRKEIIRAFSILCGGGSSQFKGNVMNAASMREMDYMKETIPVDMINYWRLHLATLGVTPKKVASYADACQQGWAPPPTNSVQKAIWDQIHAMPANPMKIEFDPKKGR